jgi:hypothetical protein
MTLNGDDGADPFHEFDSFLTTQQQQPHTNNSLYNIDNYNSNNNNITGLNSQHSQPITNSRLQQMRQNYTSKWLSTDNLMNNNLSNYRRPQSYATPPNRTSYNSNNSDAISENYEDAFKRPSPRIQANKKESKDIMNTTLINSEDDSTSNLSSNSAAAAVVNSKPFVQSKMLLNNGQNQAFKPMRVATVINPIKVLAKSNSTSSSSNNSDTTSDSSKSSPPLSASSTFSSSPLSTIPTNNISAGSVASNNATTSFKQQILNQANSSKTTNI